MNGIRRNEWINGEINKKKTEVYNNDSFDAEFDNLLTYWNY